MLVELKKPNAQYRFWQREDRSSATVIFYVEGNSGHPGHYLVETEEDDGEIKTVWIASVFSSYQPKRRRPDKMVQLMGLINEAYHVGTREEMDGLVADFRELYGDHSKKAIDDYADSTKT